MSTSSELQDKGGLFKAGSSKDLRSARIGSDMMYSYSDDDDDENHYRSDMDLDDVNALLANIEALNDPATTGIVDATKFDSYNTKNTITKSEIIMLDSEDEDDDSESIDLTSSGIRTYGGIIYESDSNFVNSNIMISRNDDDSYDNHIITGADNYFDEYDGMQSEFVYSNQDSKIDSKIEDSKSGMHLSETTVGSEKSGIRETQTLKSDFKSQTGRISSRSSARTSKLKSEITSKKVKSKIRQSRKEFKSTLKSMTQTAGGLPGSSNNMIGGGTSESTSSRTTRGSALISDGLESGLLEHRTSRNQLSQTTQPLRTTQGRTTTPLSTIHSHDHHDHSEDEITEFADSYAFSEHRSEEQNDRDRSKGLNRDFGNEGSGLAEIVVKDDNNSEDDDRGQRKNATLQAIHTLVGSTLQSHHSGVESQRSPEASLQLELPSSHREGRRGTVPEHAFEAGRQTRLTLNRWSIQTPGRDTVELLDPDELEKDLYPLRFSKKIGVLDKDESKNRGGKDDEPDYSDGGLRSRVGRSENEDTENSTRDNTELLEEGKVGSRRCCIFITILVSLVFILLGGMGLAIYLDPTLNPFNDHNEEIDGKLEATTQKGTKDEDGFESNGTARNGLVKIKGKVVKVKGKGKRNGKNDVDNTDLNSTDLKNTDSDTDTSSLLRKHWKLLFVGTVLCGGYMGLNQPEELESIKGKIYDLIESMFGKSSTNAVTAVAEHAAISLDSPKEAHVGQGIMPAGSNPTAPLSATLHVSEPRVDENAKLRIEGVVKESATVGGDSDVSKVVNDDSPSSGTLHHATLHVSEPRVDENAKIRIEGVVKESATVGGDSDVSNVANHDSPSPGTLQHHATLHVSEPRVDENAKLRIETPVEPSAFLEGSWLSFLQEGNGTISGNEIDGEIKGKIVKSGADNGGLQSPRSFLQSRKQKIQKPQDRKRGSVDGA